MGGKTINAPGGLPPMAATGSSPSTAPAASSSPVINPAASPMSAERRPCPNCSAPTPTGFRFCQNCGKEIPEEEATSAPPEQEAVSGTIGDSSGNLPQQGDPSGDSFMPTMPGAPMPVSSPSMQLPESTPNVQVQSSPHAAPQRLDTPIAGGAGGVAVPATDRPPQVTPTWGMLYSVNRDGSDGESFQLTGEWIDVGHTAEISFDDEFMAARHVRFANREGVVTVTPLEDLNGVFIRIVAPTEVQSGIRLLLGRELLELALLREQERDIEAMWRHGVAMLGSPIRDAWARISQMLPNGTIRDVRYLVSREVVIGREEGEVVFRDDEFLSRRHCKLTWNGSVCTLEDVGSSNGTFVQLEGPRQLRTGDHLRVGDQMFRFEQVNA